MTVLVLCPTRGRPERAADLFESFRATAELPSTQLVLVVDKDDPEVGRYLEIGEHTVQRYGWSPDAPWAVGLEAHETGDLVKATNSGARRFWDRDLILGCVNDDMLFRTPGWDRRMTEVLHVPGIAYGDDLFQHEQLVTSPFMSSIIPRALGWYALPSCEHLFIDNVWRDLGEALGVLHYLPDVVIEHIHPLAGKAEWDEGYEKANNQRVTDHDREAYHAWRRELFAADTAAVVEALTWAA